MVTHSSKSKPTVQSSQVDQTAREEQTQGASQSDIDTVNTEERIMRAAREVFMRKGYDGARMQEIADKAEINKALLHYYFRTKDQLFARIFAKITHAIPTTMLNTLQSDLPFKEKLRRVIQDEFRQLMAHPELPMFVVREITRDVENFKRIIMNSPMQTLYKVFASEVQKAVVNDEIRAIEPLQLFLHILALTRFPFIAKPMVRAVSNYSDDEYNNVLGYRADEVAEMIILYLEKK